MKRRQTIINYPHLNDCGGNPAGTWYVEFQYHVPGEPRKRKERIYKGLNVGSELDRRRLAEKIIKEKTAWLKSGQYLKDNHISRVYADELTYRHEARLYGNVKSGMPLLRTNISDYLTFIKPIVNEASYRDRQAKLRMFCAWLEKENLSDILPEFIERNQIIDFVVWLSDKHSYSRVTVKKYLQVVRWYFDFEIDRKNIIYNPVVRIPNTGKVVDEAPVPFTTTEIQQLKSAIERENPQLWLACLIQFYCAIRPGNELRLMKIGWIDFDNAQIRIPAIEAKNNLTEIVEIPYPLLKIFELHKLKNYDKNFYVLGKNGMPGNIHWGKNHFRMEFNKYREKLNIPANRKFYSWKHTGAIELINNGAQPYDVMEHLRHKNFSTTEKYLKKRIKSKSRRIDNFTTEI